MPRLLIVSLHFPPDASVGAKRVLRMATHLPEFGWNTTVLTVRPGYFDRHDPSLLGAPLPFRVVRTHAITPLRWARYLRDRIRRRSTGEGPHGPNPNLTAGRADAMERSAPSWRSWLATPDEYVGWIPLALAAGVLRCRPDVILASGPPFSSHLIAAGLSRILRAPLALDYRDPWTFHPGESGIPAGDPPRGRRLESWCVGRASAVIATTGSIAQELDLLRPLHSEVIPNAADWEFIGRIRPRRDSRFSIAYAGNFYGSRSPRPILEAMRALKDENLLPPEGLVLRVFGATGDIVTRAAHALGVSDHVEVEGTLPYAEGLARIRGSDVLLLVVGDSHAGMVPAKVFEYLAARRFILTLAPPGSEAGRIVVESGCGETFAPHDVSGVARCLKTRLQAPREDLPRPAILDVYDPRRTAHALDRLLASLLPRS
jgi:glycosyltransferase involved in cell wall biosynthesis